YGASRAFIRSSKSPNPIILAVTLDPPVNAIIPALTRTPGGGVPTPAPILMWYFRYICRHHFDSDKCGELALVADANVKIHPADPAGWSRGGVPGWAMIVAMSAKAGTIWISAEVAEKIRAHGAEAYPNECCGALLGRDAEGDGAEDRAREIVESIAMVNRRE